MVPYLTGDRGCFQPGDRLLTSESHIWKNPCGFATISSVPVKFFRFSVTVVVRFSERRQPALEPRFSLQQVFDERPVEWHARVEGDVVDAAL
jgi:hypothetical protein